MEGGGESDGVEEKLWRARKVMERRRNVREKEK